MMYCRMLVAAMACWLIGGVFTSSAPAAEPVVDDFSTVSDQWQLQEGKKKTGKATLTVADGVATIGGVVSRPLAVGRLASAQLRVSVRFLLPEQAPQWSSFGVALFGPGDVNDRLYAIALFGQPDAAAGEVTLFVEEPGANAKRHGTSVKDLKPGKWHTLAVEVSAGRLKVRVWPDGEAAPAKPDVDVKAADLMGEVNAVGLRTYAAEVQVDEFALNADAPAGQTAPAAPSAPAAPKAPSTSPAARSTATPGAPLDQRLDRTTIPAPVFDAEPELVDLYWTAWSLARANVKEAPGAPQSPYLDEGFSGEYIWIWDTCFMGLFSRYSPQQFLGVQSLLNFYAVMHDGASSPLIIHHPDNPPLFAWVEYDTFQHTNDRARLKWLLEDKQYLQKHYKWFATARRGMSVPGARKGVDLMPQALGFQWTGVASGMDNSPRFADRDALRFDALAQQGLSALYISRLAKQIDDAKLAAEYQQEYGRIKDLINRNYWDEQDGMYYDRKPDGSFIRVKTPATYWPMLAEMCSPEQAARLVDHARDPQTFGGDIPWPSLARTDPNFDGNYWRGAVWLPLAYMATKALEKYDQHEVADEMAMKTIHHMNQTYKEITPHTIWECYNPDKPRPGMHDGKRSRQDFCGWSALGPISMLIENVLGFYDVDATTRTVKWRLHQPGRHGISNLRFGDVQLDLIHDKGTVTATANRACTLIINGKTWNLSEGKAELKVR